MIIICKLIPPLLKSFLLSLISSLIGTFNLIFISKFRKHELHKLKIKKKAIILGTGPSIQKINFDNVQLNNFDVFTLSNFILHPKIKKINPGFHCIAAYSNDVDYDDYMEWLKLINKKLPSETSIITDSKNKNKFINVFKGRKIFYIKTFKQIHFNNFELNKTIPKPCSVPLLALPCALKMGYKEIYLGGCDHNTLKFYKEDILNFYKKENDIRKNLTNKKYWKKTSLISELTANKNLMIQYYNYYKYSTRNNIKIYNLSKESWVDYFPHKLLKKIK